MNDEKIQKLISEYWQEEVEYVINEIITNKDTKKVIEKSLKDRYIQKALEEWDRDGVEEWVQRIAKEVYQWTFWGKVVKSAFAMIWGAVLWIVVWNKNEH
jgi:mannitol-1-phosphate/altronate dehydrogenase